MSGGAEGKVRIWSITSSHQVPDMKWSGVEWLSWCGIEIEVREEVYVLFKNTTARSRSRRHAQILKHSNTMTQTYARAFQALVSSMSEHRGPVNALKINKDSSQCISASADGSCIVWCLVSFLPCCHQTQSSLSLTLFLPSYLLLILVRCSLMDFNCFLWTCFI